MSTDTRPDRELVFAALRRDFPLLQTELDGRSIVYLDSAATSLKPQQVVGAVCGYYQKYTANVHRGNHLLSEIADTHFEESRARVAEFIGAAPEQIIWTSGATDSINQVARMLQLAASDRVLVSQLEHHSNLLPWMSAAEVDVVRVDCEGMIDEDHFEQLLRRRPRLVAISHLSNVLGTVQPVERLVDLARRAGALTLVDASQSVPRMPVDVGALGCDFLVFSGHKMLGPTGIGVLYVNPRHFASLVPCRWGGGMVKSVIGDEVTLRDVPARFEAGTPHIAGAIGLSAAVRYLQDSADPREVFEHEQELTQLAVAGLEALPRVRLWPRVAPTRVGIISFTVDGMESDDVAMMLSHRANIMCRSGVHCAEPLARSLEIDSFVRASFYLYTTREDVQGLIQTVAGIVTHL